MQVSMVWAVAIGLSTVALIVGVAVYPRRDASERRGYYSREAETERCLIVTRVACLIELVWLVAMGLRMAGLA